MTKRSRFLLVIPLGIVLLIVGAVILIPAYLASGSFRDRVRGGIAQKLDRSVELESLKISLLPAPRLVLGGVVLGPPREGPRSWIEVEEADLSVRLMPLLKRQIEVVSARIDSMVVRVEMPDSTETSSGARADWASGDPSTPSRSGRSGDEVTRPASGEPASPSAPLRTEAGGSGFDVAIEDFHLSRGAVHVVGPDGKPSLDLAGLEAQLEASSTRAGDLELTGSSTASLLRIHLPGGTLGEGLTLKVDPTLQYHAATDELSITRFDLDLGGLPIAVTGSVANLKTDRRAALDFSGGPAAVDGILGFLPSGLVPQLEGVRSSGTVSMRGTVNGSLLETPPRFEIDLSLSDGSIAHPRLPEAMTDVMLDVHANPDTLRIKNLHAVSANSRIDVAGTIVDYLVAPKADLRVRGDADLVLVAALQEKPDMPSLAGRASADLVARGPIQDPTHPLGIAGTIVLTDVSAEGGSMQRPIRNVSGTLQLDGSSLTTDGLSLEIGRSDYRIAGSVADYRALLPGSASGSSTANLRVASQRLDLDEFSPPPGSASAGGDTTSPSPSGQSGNAFFAMLSRLEGPVAFKADQMIVRSVETRSVDAVGRLQKGLVTLDRAALGAFGGRVEVSGIFDLRNLERPQLDLNLALKEADASQLFRQAVTIDQLSRLGGYLSGTIDLSAKLSGNTDQKFQLDLRSLTSLGELKLTGGKLSGHPLQTALGSFLEVPQLSDLPIREWLQPFSIENGRLQYRDLEIKALGGELRAEGWQSLEGQIGMNATLLLPPELSEGLRRYVPRELQSLVFEPEGGRIVVPISMSGPATAPRITLDSKKLEEQAKARLADKVDAERERLEEKLEDEVTGRVDEIKDRLLDQLPGSAPADSASADSTANDLEEDVRGVLENLFRKKK